MNPPLWFPLLVVAVLALAWVGLLHLVKTALHAWHIRRSKARAVRCAAYAGKIVVCRRDGKLGRHCCAKAEWQGWRRGYRIDMGIEPLDGSAHRFAQLEEIRLATSAEIADSREGEWR